MYGDMMISENDHSSLINMEMMNLNSAWGLFTLKNVTIIVIGYITTRTTITIYRYFVTKSKVRAKGQECQLACEKLAEHLDQKAISLEKRDAIVKLSISELHQKLQKGEIKAVDVCQSYQAVAMEIDRRLNCVVEPIWEAEEMAIARDQSTAKKGIMHGIPVSFKENYYIKGYDSTLGLELYIGQPMTEDAVVFQVLKKQGAVPFVRTNLPQGMLSFECSNPIYGQTNHPQDQRRAPGGSSGGEAALIASGGSILGFGSDIGGSLRIPANMCGICSLKPTYGRISKKGTERFGKGQTLIGHTPGPMAREVEGLVLGMRALLCQHMFDLDPSVPPIPFQDDVYKGKAPLRIGYFLDDGYIQSVPSMHRAVDMAKFILEAKGHTLVPFKPIDPKRMFKVFLKVAGGDGSQELMEIMKNDVYDSSVAPLMYLSRLPATLLKVMAYISTKIAKDDLVGDVVSSIPALRSVYEYQKAAEELHAFREENLRLWRSAKIDALICPGFAYPALCHQTSSDVVGGVTYVTAYNVLNYPAGSVPVTKVSTEDIENMKHYPTRTMFEKNIKKMMSNDTIGLPCGVQCVSLPFKEELVLRIMKEIENGLNE